MLSPASWYQKINRIILVRGVNTARQDRTNTANALTCVTRRTTRSDVDVEQETHLHNKFNYINGMSTTKARNSNKHSCTPAHTVPTPSALEKLNKKNPETNRRHDRSH